MKRARRFDYRSSLRLVGVFLALSCSTWAWADSAGAHKASTLETSDGEHVYSSICQGCHMPDGKGAVGAGHYPAFAGNPAMASPTYMAATILNGRRNMPSFIPQKGGSVFFIPSSLTDEQVAAVINYIRSHFGNSYKDSITAAQVQALHPQSGPADKPAKSGVLHAEE